MASYPIHDYGTGSVIEGLRNFRATKAAKEQAFLQVLSQGSGQGILQNYGPGAPAYERAKDAMGKDVADMIGARNKAAKQQIDLINQRDAFGQFGKIDSAMTSMVKNLGEGARKTPMYTKFGEQRAKNLNAAFPGLNFSYDPIKTLEEQSETNRNKIMGGIGNMIAGLDENSTGAEINAVKLKMNDYTKMAGSDKDIIKGWESALTSVEKSVIAKAKVTEAKRKEGAERTEWDRQQKATRLNKPATLAGMTANVVQSLRDGVPIETMTKTDQLIAKLWQEKGSKDATWREQVFGAYKKIPGNENKTEFDFDKEHPARVVSTEKKEELPRKKYTDQIRNQPGFMKKEAQKVVSGKLKQNMKLKAGIASGTVSNEMLVTKEMQSWVKEEYPNAVFGESNGDYYWAVPGEGGTFKVVADENGWVK